MPSPSKSRSSNSDNSIRSTTGASSQVKAGTLFAKSSTSAKTSACEELAASSAFADAVTSRYISSTDAFSVSVLGPQTSRMILRVRAPY